MVLVTVCEVSLSRVAIGFAFSSVLYLAPDFGTWKMDNSLKLASCTEDFLEFFHMLCGACIGTFSHLESLTEFRTKFRTFVDKWTEFLASDAGKGSYNIQACADIGTFRGPRGTWRQYMSGKLFSVTRN